MMTRWLYLLLIIVFSSACKETEEEKVTHLIQEWNNRIILFPVSTSFISYEKKGLRKFNIKNEKYAIVTYVDSLGCMSCKLQLPGWSEFINTLDSISGASVPCMFFFNPVHDGKTDLIRLMKRTHFNYPVCIDEKDFFNKLNHFPSNMMFQTFLLNKDNRVIAMGNPVHNPKVKELYFKIIRGEKPMLSTQKIQTNITFDRMGVDLETFNWKQEQVADFILTNTGNELLVIEGISTSCGCTTVEYSKEPVQPDKNLTLKVRYKAEHPEHFNKTVTIFCNAEGSPFQLKVRGNAE